MSRRSALTDLLVGVLGLVGVAALVATLAGVRLVPVLTGSMAPGLPSGSLALTTPVAPQDVRAGMVLAFRPPAPFDGTGRAVMHRATAVDAGPPAWVETRGDANPGPDPWRLALTPGTQVGRQRLAVPLVGRLVAGGRRTTVPVVAGCALLTVAVRTGRRPVVCSCRPPVALPDAPDLVAAPLAAPLVTAQPLAQTPSHGRPPVPTTGAASPRRGATAALGGVAPAVGVVGLVGLGVLVAAVRGRRASPTRRDGR